MSSTMQIHLVISGCHRERDPCMICHGGSLGHHFMLQLKVIGQNFAVNHLISEFMLIHVYAKMISGPWGLLREGGLWYGLGNTCGKGLLQTVPRLWLPAWLCPTGCRRHDVPQWVSQVGIHMGCLHERFRLILIIHNFKELPSCQTIWEQTSCVFTL